LYSINLSETFSADLSKLQSLLDTFGTLSNTQDGPGQCRADDQSLSLGLEGMRNAFKEAKQQKLDEEEKLAIAKAERTAAAQAKLDETQAKKELDNRWNKEEISWLAKGAKKFPAGSANRWETVANYINQQMRLPNPKTKEACLAKYTQIQQANYKANLVETTVNTDTSTTAAAGGGDKKAANSKKTGAAVSVSTTTTTTTTTVDVEGEKWSKEQQKQLEDALRKYPASMDKAERWSSVAKEVEGKTKKQCIERFKVLRAKVAAAKNKN
jgi:DnaJ family protein C protein 2